MIATMLQMLDDCYKQTGQRMQVECVLADRTYDHVGADQAERLKYGVGPRWPLVVGEREGFCIERGSGVLVVRPERAIGPSPIQMSRGPTSRIGKLELALRGAIQMLEEVDTVGASTDSVVDEWRKLVTP